MANPGDQVVCRIRDSSIINIYDNDRYEEHIFDVVAKYEDGHLLYVSNVFFLNDCIKITKENHIKYNVDKRFIDCNVYYIGDNRIVRIYRKIDGMRCSKCDDFIQMSEPNQTDGTLICWRCRSYPQYK